MIEAVADRLEGTMRAQIRSTVRFTVFQAKRANRIKIVGWDQAINNYEKEWLFFASELFFKQSR